MKPEKPLSESKQLWLEQKEAKDKRVQAERELVEILREERNMLRDKHGLERFFIPDHNNEIDREIVIRIKELTFSLDPIKQEELICRKILAKRLSTGIKCNAANKTKIDTAIEASIELRCKKYKKSWNEVVRNAFCVHFGIKEKP